MSQVQTRLDPRRNLPSVDAVLQEGELASLREKVAPDFLTKAVRVVLNRERERVTQGESVPDAQLVAQEAAAELFSWLAGDLKPVINGTGIILHTGLGRAPLAPEAREAVSHVAEG